MSFSVLLLVAAVPLLLMWILALVEVALRIDLSGGRRAAWILGLLLIPIVGLAAYVVVRPVRRSSLRATVDADASRAADELVRAAEQQARGEISDDDYRAEMARLTG